MMLDNKKDTNEINDKKKAKINCKNGKRNEIHLKGPFENIK